MDRLACVFKIYGRLEIELYLFIQYADETYEYNTLVSPKGNNNNNNRDRTPGYLNW